VCAADDAAQVEEQACVAGDVVVVDGGVCGGDDREIRVVEGVVEGGA